MIYVVLIYLASILFTFFWIEKNREILLELLVEKYGYGIYDPMITVLQIFPYIPILNTLIIIHVTYCFIEEQITK